MRNSALVVRIFVVVFTALFFTALLTALLFSAVSRVSFARMKEEELRPRAEALGNLFVAFSKESEEDVIESIMNSRVGDESLLGAYGILVDSDGNMLHSSGMDESILQWFEPVFARSLAGEAVATSDYGIIPTQNMVFVSVPIRDGAQILGAIILFVPLYEAMTAMGGLVGALMLSLLVVLPFVFVMVFFLVRRIVNPLREMRDVAMAMAAGNFKVRASDEWRGEVGQLGRSLNYMAGELSKTISDVEFERNRLRYVVDGLSEGIIAVDQLGRVTHRNPALEEMLGVSEERLDNPEQIADDNIRDAFKNVLQSGEPASLQMEAPDKTKIIRVTITPIHDDRGETAGAVGMFLDITQSERLERTRRDYVANVSHELRTPLTAVRGLIEPLRDGMVRDEDTRKRYYDIILREVLRLSRLIDDLMELSRLQSGAIAVEVHPLDIRELLLDICERYANIAREKNRNFTWADAIEDCPRVVTNPDRIEQLMVILLDNAIKYTGEGCTIGVDLIWNTERVVVTVYDNGQGIAEDDLQHVFERFYKADKSHSTKGSGLGLSIARELLRWMGEDIWVKSKVGEGTAFSFTIRREVP